MVLFLNPERPRDEYYLSLDYKEFEEIGSIFLKNGDEVPALNFEVAINDAEFDNEDNPYG